MRGLLVQQQTLHAMPIHLFVIAVQDKVALLAAIVVKGSLSSLV